MNDYMQRDGDAAEVDPTEDQIVVEIEETRANMSGTIDAIGHRLNPQTIAEQTREHVREATVGRVERLVEDAGRTAQHTSNSIIDTIRENPVPAALAALGIGWLIVRGREAGSANGGYRASDWRYADRGSTYGYAPYEAGQGDGESITDRMSEAGEQIRQRTDALGQQAQRAAGDVAERSQQALSQAQWQAERAAAQAQRQFDRTLQENPLALGALALGVGAAIGLAIPETRQERELLGEQRDQLVSQIGQVATAALGEAEKAARETGQQLQEAARES
jgi:hypothetical protein